MMIAYHDLWWLREPDFFLKKNGGPDLGQMSQKGVQN